MSAPLLPADVDARTRTVRGGTRADGEVVHLAVAEVGDREAPAVVLAHGVGSSARFVVAACAAPVTAAGWRLVTYDARGHGASTPCAEVADHHLDAHTADLAAVVAAAGPLAAVGGVSFGGHAALRLTVAGGPEGTAVPRLVCLPAWVGRTPAGSGPHAAVAEEVRRIGIAAVVDRLRADAALAGWLRDTLVADQGRHDPASIEAALLALDGAEGPTLDEVAAVSAPTAVVAWRDDPGHPFEVAEAIAGAVAQGTLTELAMVDLEVSLTRFGEAVVTALRSVLPAPRRSPSGRRR